MRLRNEAFNPEQGLLMGGNCGLSNTSYRSAVPGLISSGLPAHPAARINLPTGLHRTVNPFWDSEGGGGGGGGGGVKGVRIWRSGQAEGGVGGGGGSIQVSCLYASVFYCAFSFLSVCGRAVSVEFRRLCLSFSMSRFSLSPSLPLSLPPSLSPPPLSL